MGMSRARRWIPAVEINFIANNIAFCPVDIETYEAVFFSKYLFLLYMDIAPVFVLPTGKL
jgi:hypothetical protein